MTEHQASRTLVKSPPELWAECSNAGSLARHLGEFGEIRITKLEPETAVAWEGDVARGTVRLEPSGWGTRVILTAAVEDVEPEAPADSEPEAALDAEVEPGVDAEPKPEEPVPEKPEPEEPAPGAELLEVPGLAEVLYDPAPAKSPISTTPSTREPRTGLMARLLLRFRRRREAPAAAEPAGGEGWVAVEPVVAVEPEPVAVEPDPLEPAVEPFAVDPGPVAVEPEPPPPPPSSPSPESVLACALDSLGSAHHRPFSRA
jgi:hypothetical protein